MSNLYERRPEYWTADLEDRRFEHAVKAALDALGWQYQDNTEHFGRPDLYVLRNIRGKMVRAAVELKDKRQPYRGRWPELAGVPEGELLVLDEVAARKLLGCAPRALLLFWDRTHAERPYIVYTIFDLFCMPKVRVQRPIKLNDQRVKAKWLLDARHGHTFGDLNQVFAFVANFLAHGLQADLRRLEPLGPYLDETLETL